MRATTELRARAGGEVPDLLLLVVVVVVVVFPPCKQHRGLEANTARGLRKQRRALARVQRVQGQGQAQEGTGALGSGDAVR